MNVIRIAFLIRKLEIGGAERQLSLLAAGLDRKRFAPLILTFYPGGEFEKALLDAGVEVRCLNKSGRWDLLSFQYKLTMALRAFNPHLVHAFQGPPNLLALLARPFVSKMRVIWGFRASNTDLGSYDYSRRLVALAMRLSSRRMDMAIANSHAGRHHAVSMGFDSRKFYVVENGIDTGRFVRDMMAGANVRREWGIPTEAPLIGLVARLDVKKDHTTFLTAAAQIAASHPSIRFACIGWGSQQRLKQLQLLACNLGIEEKVTWAGVRSDMQAVYSALDINTLTSKFGEGFPNSVGEAMAVGLPCIVTDCGDAAAIVGETGIVVAPGDAIALAAGWEEILSMPKEKLKGLKGRCRDRIVEHYSTESMIAKSATLYAGLSHGCLEPSMEGPHTEERENQT